jgi:hypothetical protein
MEFTLDIACINENAPPNPFARRMTPHFPGPANKAKTPNAER